MAEDWTCACGRTVPEGRLRCADCGQSKRFERRVEAPPSATDAAAEAAPDFEPARRRRRLRPADEPLPPNPPGSGPVRLMLQSVHLDLPNWCCCCLAPADARSWLDTYASHLDTDYDQVASSLLGYTSAKLIGIGWRHRDEHARGIETRLRCPLCADCKRHEHTREKTQIAVGAAMALGTMAAVYPVRHDGLEAVLMAAGAVVLVGLVLLFVLPVILARGGPNCPPGRPVQITWKGQQFRIRFSNATYGRRVAEMNPHA